MGADAREGGSRGDRSVHSPCHRHEVAVAVGPIKTLQGRNATRARMHYIGVVQQDCTPEHYCSACCFRDPFMPCIEFPISQICAKVTVWGGRLSKRFCKMFSESSPCLLGLHGRCAVQANGLCSSLKTFYKKFYSTCCPRL